MCCAVFARRRALGTIGTGRSASRRAKGNTTLNYMWYRSGAVVSGAKQGAGLLSFASSVIACAATLLACGLLACGLLACGLLACGDATPASSESEQSAAP